MTQADEKQSTYEDTSTTLGCGAFTAQAPDLAIGVDLVVLQDAHLDLLTLVLDTLGGVVCLLLALLGTAAKAKDEMQGAARLDVVVRHGRSVL